MFRHSCGVCHYTNLQRPSDITLADFWGWEKSVPSMNEDDKGISLVLLNTEKGKRIFDSVKVCMSVKEVDVAKSIQTRMQFPTPINPLRNQFEKDYSIYGFKYILYKYVQPGFIRKIFNKLTYGRARL